MSGYSVWKKEKNIMKLKLAGKKIVTVLMIVSLSLSMVSWQNFTNIFAAVATYGRTDDGVWAYKLLTESNKTVSIRPASFEKIKSSKIEIPRSVDIQGDSYTVTEIAPYAYFQCVCDDCLKKNKMSLSTAWEDGNENYEGKDLEAEISEVVIPSTVTEIGSSAFESAYLSKVTFEETKNLATIGESAFSGCAFKNIEIPASVSTIGNYAFSDGSLQTITFKEGSKLKQIADSTFEESKLKAITLPESITKIGESAFLRCKLETITIPASVTTIAASAFEGNAKLKEVNFAENGALTKIRIGAFLECALTEVTIPASVTTIGVCAFANNDDLKTVTFKTTSKISKLNPEAFAYVPEYNYEEDYIEDMSYEENISVAQVNVENYDVYQWIINTGLFTDDTKIYSAKTRVFEEKRKEANVKDDVAMEENKQATIHIDDYIKANTGYHFEDSKFEYSNTFDSEQSSTGNIKKTEFISYGYPYVVLKANQEVNEYEIVYDTNEGDTPMESTKCQYDKAITISSNIPTRIGYEFKGWSKSASGEGEIYQPGEVVEENFTDEDGATVTLYAVWKEITKKVTIHFSTPKKKSADSAFEVVITRDGRKIQQHDISSTEVGDKEIVISGAKIGETYVITCTNYEKTNGKKTYYKTVRKEVTIE